jgi:hypothetical protein
MSTEIYKELAPVGGTDHVPSPPWGDPPRGRKDREMETGPREMTCLGAGLGGVATFNSESDESLS